MAEPLYRVIYTSRASRAMTRGELEDLLLGSRKRNAERGITGLMLYDAGNFIQVLEGPKSALDALYDSITQDPRHHSVERVATGEIQRRDFDDWAMGFHNLALFKQFDVSEYRKAISGENPLDPRATYQMFLKFRDALK